MELRNVPLNRIQAYLEDAGGTLTGDRSAQGAGWQARLDEMPPVVIGTMRIRRDLLVLEGNDQAALKAAVDFMRRKTMRGGG